jgi:hypothetical protein
MTFDELLNGLKSDLRQKVKKPSADDENYYLLNAVGKVIKEKGLKSDVRSPETIKILEGSSGEIVQEAAREIWRQRKQKQRERERTVSGGKYCEIEEIKIKEVVILPSDKLRDQKIRWPQINIHEFKNTKKHKGTE